MKADGKSPGLSDSFLFTFIPVNNIADVEAQVADVAADAVV